MNADTRWPGSSGGGQPSILCFPSRIILFGVVKAAVTRERRGNGTKETRSADLNSPDILFRRGVSAPGENMLSELSAPPRCDSPAPQAA